MDDPLSVLEAQCEFIEDQLDNCQTQDQRNQLRPSYVQAQLNYQRAVNKIFQANDARIADLVTQMKQAQVSLEQMVAQLADTAKVIAAISTAVKIGTQLASMAK
jgi:hypothetical protein